MISPLHNQHVVPPGGPAMFFSIGTRVYRVVRVSDLHFDGERADGCFDGSTRTIWLDASLGDAAIVDVLRHEVYHAWEYETATPRTAEERAQFGSTVGAAFDHEFNAQGGLKGLLALPMVPGGKRPPSLASTILERLREIRAMAAQVQAEITALENLIENGGGVVVDPAAAEMRAA